MGTDRLVQNPVKRNYIKLAVYQYLLVWSYVEGSCVLRLVTTGRVTTIYADDKYFPMAESEEEGLFPLIKVKEEGEM